MSDPLPIHASPLPGKTIRKITWEEFRNAGLLWWINRSLHLLGFALVVDVDQESQPEKVIRAYPARCAFRGFDSESEEHGFKVLTTYLSEAVPRLMDETFEVPSPEEAQARPAEGEPAKASGPRKILGPWEPRDLCIKRFDAQGQGVGLVSYILAYSDDDKPLSEVDALLKQEGWTLFEDATPTEQAVYVQQRMKARAVQAVEVRGEDHG